MMTIFCAVTPLPPHASGDAHIAKAILLFLGLSGALAAPTASLDNELVSLDFDAAGFATRLVERTTGRVLADGRAPFVSAVCADGPVEPKAFDLRDGKARWRFPKGEVVLGVTPFAGGWTFEVLRADVPDVRRLLVGGLAGVVCTNYSSTTAQCVSDLRSGIAVRGYEYVSHGRYGARTELALEADRPLVGRKFGFAAGPRKELVEALKAMTVASGFPHSTSGGAWSTGSEQCRGSYLNANVTADSVDDFIAVALLGGFDVVHFRENWYAWRGHYPVNTNDFPRGIVDLKEAVAKVHAAGLRAGLHTLTGCIDPRDAWVTPVCSSDLMNWTTYTLAKPLADNATELLVAEEPAANHDVVFTYSGNGNVLRVGGELIQYAGVRRAKPYAFTGLVRGAFGTRRAAHAGGETVAYLQQRYNAFYPDPDSRLAHDLAEAIGSVYRTCGFDQVYLDGTEGMMTEYGMAKMRALVYAACTRDGRPCLVEDSHSGRGAGAWWFHSRKGAWDSTYWAPKRFHDFHVAQMRKDCPRLSEFREIQMGWWCPCAGSDEHRAHAEDDMEYYAGKNAALDASMSVAGVNPTGRTLMGWQDPSGFEVFGELAILGWYERFRRAGAFRQWFTDHLSVPRQEARLRQDADGVWRAAKAVSAIHRVAGPETAKWRTTFAERPQSAIVRIEALGTAAYDDPSAMTGLAASVVPTLAVTTAPCVRAERPRVTDDPARGTVAVFRATNKGDSPRGAWAAVRRTFAPYADIGSRRALACWVKGDGSGALANFQVQSPREYGLAYSEHYVRLDFTGWRLVEMPFSETDVESYADLVWPYAGGYAPFFHRQITGTAVCSLSVYLNEIPVGKSAEVAFTDVRFVPKRKMTLSGVSLTVNGVRHPVPFALETGEIAECADGCWTHYDVDRTPLRRLPATSTPSLAEGANVCRFAAESVVGGTVPRAEVTLFALGEKEPALVDLKTLPADRRALLDRECMMPVLYAPKSGFDTLPALAVRPGERAEPVFTVRGPIGPFKLTVGDETRQFDGVDAGKSLTAPRGTFRPVAGAVPVRIEPLTSDEARAVFFFTKLALSAAPFPCVSAAF